MRIVSVGAILVLLIANMNAIGATKAWQNKLQPFTSDGCSWFPDGVPVVDQTRWLKCCVQHDVAYWKGGTAEQREKADEQLGKCVSEVAGTAVGEAMYLGVRAGGAAALPLRWRWGYGWVMNRGYEALGDAEKAQVDALSASIPKEFDRISLEFPPAIPVRASVTGDYCLDIGLEAISAKLGQSVSIDQVQENVEERSNGFSKTLKVQIDQCRSPISVTLLLLKRNACTAATNELVARGRIRMTNIIIPSVCSKPEGN